jgi:hypothetical protein
MDVIAECPLHACIVNEWPQEVVDVDQLSEKAINQRPAPPHRQQKPNAVAIMTGPA